MTASPTDVLAFWFRPGHEDRWFARDDAFDAAVRAELGPLHRAAADGAFDGWAETAEGALALVLLLDQVPRNVYRGTASAFATDAKARDVAWDAIGRGFDWSFNDPDRRNFLYLPLMHAEDLDDQRAMLRLFEERVPDRPASLDAARAHLRIIERFGRFPHRNAALGRESTAEELAFLAEPGSSF